MNEKIITEFVKFQLLETASVEQLISKTDILNEFQRKLDGYIDAELVKSIEGNAWRLIYHFESLEKVKVIGEKMRGSKVFDEFIPLIVPGSLSVTFYHQLKKWQITILRKNIITGGHLMKIQSLKLVCFSPTGTTKAIIQGIARGINQSNVELIDITNPDTRKHQLQTLGNELLVVGVPVYMGRVPALLMEWIHAINAHNTLAVCVVVYGNRVFDDALLELKDVLIICGCKPIAGAAFIGEHSFSSSETPTAEGRPDENDLHNAELFGRKINEILLSVSSVDQIVDIHIPGNYPYGGITELWSVDFIAVSNECKQCGICADGCPVGAIDLENSSVIDKGKCITCCACIKNCPQNARTMKPSLVKDAAIRLNTLYKARKEPVFYF